MNLIFTGSTIFFTGAIIYFICKRFAFYKFLDKRQDLYDKFYCLHDGLQFNLSQGKFYIIWIFMIKTFVSFAVILLMNWPVLALLAVFCIALSNFWILILSPFQFSFVLHKELYFFSMLMA